MVDASGASLASTSGSRDAAKAARNQATVRELVAKHGLTEQVESYAQALFDLAMLDVNPAWFAERLTEEAPSTSVGLWQLQPSILVGAS